MGRPTSLKVPDAGASAPASGRLGASAATVVVVGGTGGAGVWLRREPAGERITVWPDGAPFLVVGSDSAADDQAWRRVRAADGQVGWVASTYLRDVDPATLADLLDLVGDPLAAPASEPIVARQPLVASRTSPTPLPSTGRLSGGVPSAATPVATPMTPAMPDAPVVPADPPVDAVVALPAAVATAYAPSFPPATVPDGAVALPAAIATAYAAVTPAGTPTQAPTPTQEPTQTPRATATPRPTRTPKPTQTMAPTRTPTSTQVPSTSRTRQ